MPSAGTGLTPGRGSGGSRVRAVIALYAATRNPSSSKRFPSLAGFISSASDWAAGEPWCVLSSGSTRRAAAADALARGRLVSLVVVILPGCRLG